MFGIKLFRSRNKTSELDDLRAEVLQLKSNLSRVPLLASAGPGFSPLGTSGEGGLNHGAAHQQLKAFRGHQATAINAIATRVAGQRLCVGVKSGAPRTIKSAGNDLEALESHALLDVFADPNPLMVPFNLIWLLVVHFKLCGLAYWWLRTEDDGQLQIWPLPPHWVRQKRGYYEVRPDGAPEAFNVPEDEMAVFSLPHPCDPFGAVFSPLAAQATTVNVDESILESQSQAFKRGIHPSVVLRVGSIESADGMKVRRSLSPEQRNQLIAAVRRAHAGALNHNDPLILDSIIESVEKFSLTPAELDWLDSAKWTRSRIFQAYGVNPLIVGEIEGANRAQAVVAEQNFCDSVVNPLLMLLGQCITEWIAKPFYGDNVVVWFEPAVAHDAELHSKNWATAIARGVVTPNEYRRNVLNLPDIEGGDELPAPSIGITASGQTEFDKAFDLLGGAEPTENVIITKTTTEAD